MMEIVRADLRGTVMYLIKPSPDAAELSNRILQQNLQLSRTSGYIQTDQDRECLEESTVRKYDLVFW